MSNLAEIVDTGALLCDDLARPERLHTDVGNQGIKEDRRQRTVPVGPGGTVSSYVPFYYGTRSPMMFKIACDHRDGKVDSYPDGDRPLIYFGTSIGDVLDAGLEWVGTDGNARTATTEFTCDLEELDEMVDWPLMRKTMWNSTSDDLDRQRRRMAEFLVFERVPLATIRGLAAYSDEHAEQARQILAGLPLAREVTVRPDWYYGYRRRQS